MSTWKDSLVGLNEHAAPWVPLKALVSICSYVYGTLKSHGMLMTVTTAGYSNGVEIFEPVHRLAEFYYELIELM